ncbi:LLM class flavin-dependent oxidoreductase [Nocardioides seonyuensis]|uniref:LLM class flavin-dependent oxidoreductase n=1 Tax=Nocardioides seonyuensis TaxID=2518371 RepID=A0A4P7IFF9_9ACTN|nr:LLM class flavin-dependent oxidoreductase [Nocardioides seonyuensis]QBX55550.1 LLM class flavin-dependent oxidoreductase [Nocardioides seonyuensis]
MTDSPEPASSSSEAVSYDALGTRARPTFGLDTFGDAPLDGAPGNHAATIREVVAEAVQADRVGVDYIGLGEHHRPDYAISAPDVVLAAIAGQTERIRLGTGVTVLSSDDPIRVYERFATLDAVSNGRAEVQLGRGSFIESFSLFGLDLSDYDRLFAEKLDLFAALQAEEPVHWQGTIRPPVEGKQVYPTTAAGSLPAWVGVGGTPESVVRAARYAMPLMLAVIGGSPAAFEQLADLYRRALGQLGHPELPIGMHSPGHVAETDELAREQLYPHQAELVTRLGRERGWPPYSRIAFEQSAGPQGALFVGSPETVAQKIAWAVELLGLSRFQLKYSVGELPHDQRMESIRLYGEEVIPRVRELLGNKSDNL